MCWISKECIKQIAEEDIPVFKIVNCNKTSVFKNFLYEENTKYDLGKEIDVHEGVIVNFLINEGFHSYCKKCKIEITDIESKEFFRVVDLLGTVLLGHKSLLILECLIPKGATYYINEKGECVSDKLKTLKFYKINDYINIR